MGFASRIVSKKNANPTQTKTPMPVAYLQILRVTCTIADIAPNPETDDLDAQSTPTAHPARAGSPTLSAGSVQCYLSFLKRYRRKDRMPANLKRSST